MNFQVIDVTPAMAKEWLKGNQQNRPIRKSYVHALAQSMKRGEWAVTHQAIALNGTRLVDGQHRLLAVVQSGLPRVTMTVARDADSATFDAIDIGVKRSLSDIYRDDIHVMHPVAFIARLLFGQAVSPREVQPIYMKFSEPLREIMKLTDRNIKRFSAAPIKVSALAAVLSGERKEYVYDIYRNMCEFRVEELPRAAQILVKQMTVGEPGGRKVAGSQSNQLLVRSWIAFQESNANLQKILVKNLPGRIDEVRTIYRNALS